MLWAVSRCRPYRVVHCLSWRQVLGLRLGKCFENFNVHLIILEIGCNNTHTVLRQCCKGDAASQGRNGKFDPLPRPNPLTNRQKLRRFRYILDLHAKFSCDPSWVFPVCAKLHVKDVYSASFFPGSSKDPQPRPRNQFSHSTSNNAVPRKDVPFRH